MKTRLHSLTDDSGSPQIVPIVTVLMPVFNAERFLTLATKSILNQSYSEFELLVVDDGSDDHSLQILQEFANADRRIQILSRPNTGLVGALQDGLERARGRYIARMDADDISTSRRLETQLEFLTANPDVVGISGAMRYIDELGNPIFERFPPTSSVDIERGLRSGIGESFLHGASMVRKQAIQDVGGYRREFECAEDVDLYLRLCQVGQLANLQSIVLEYRMHQNSICHRQADLQRNRLSMLIGGFSSSIAKSSTKTRTHRSTAAGFYANIALKALIANNLKTSRVNAIQSLRINPFAWRAIVILVAATNAWFAFMLRKFVKSATISAPT